MSKKSIFLIFILFVTVLFGCQKETETKTDDSNSIAIVKESVTIQPLKGNAEKLAINDAKTIFMIKEGVEHAEKQPGIVNMSEPEYKISIGDKAYFLWVNEHSGTIMDTKDTHIIYSLSEISASHLYTIVHKK